MNLLKVFIALTIIFFEGYKSMYSALIELEDE